jgi:hypothetical protein
MRNVVAIFSLPAIASALMTGVLTLSLDAAAQSTAAEPDTMPARVSADPWLSIDGTFGLAGQPEAAGASHFASLGLTGLCRPSWLTFGATLEVDSQVTLWNESGNTQYFMGGLGGATWTLADWFSIETLAELGAHVKMSGDVFRVEDTDEITSEKDSTKLPYAGVRVAPTFTFGKLRTGPWLQAREDIGRATARYDSIDCAQDDCTARTESHQIGGRHLAGGVFVGLVLGR